MHNLQIKFRVHNKGLAPRPIRLENPGWAGQNQKMVPGSEPQPWHCLPFVEGATYGLELLFPYETTCQVVNDNGLVRFEWDYANEPGGGLTGGEFVTFFPKERSKFYLFNTSVDLQPPAGYALRTEPHPRYFMDETGTFPLSMIGHVQAAWWPKMLFVVFRAPMPGQRHVFRYREPYAQLLFVPHKRTYELNEMSLEEAAQRAELERNILSRATDIAKNVWPNAAQYPFNDHYKVLARANSRDGIDGVRRTVSDAVQKHQASLPSEHPLHECLRIGGDLQTQGRFSEARSLYFHVLSRDPVNAEAVSRLGIIAALSQLPLLALDLMQKAVDLQPQSPQYQANLGEVLQRIGRHDEAVDAFHASLRLAPNDPQVLSNLGLAQARKGELAAGLDSCKKALAMSFPSPLVYFRMGVMYAEHGHIAEARECYQAALRLDPSIVEIQQALQSLPPSAG